VEITGQVREQFFDILNHKKIIPLYQPIVSLENGEIFGYEALSRITLENCCFNTEEMFQIAKQLKKVWELEEICRTLSLKNAVNKPKDKKLFLNVDANIIHDKEFQNGITLKRLQEYGLQPKDIIFEITERTAIADLKTFQDSVEHYKKQDFEIAIDDVGSGYSGLNRICAVSPSLLKIDMAIVRGIDADAIKQSLVTGIVQFCHGADISLIAEGIETESEFETLIQLGVKYGQGYYLERPKKEIGDIADYLKEKIKKIYSNEQRNTYKNSFFGTVETICKCKVGVHVSKRAVEVYDKMKEDTSITEACIVDDNNHVVGVLTRASMLQIFSGRYGYNLHAKKTVLELMSQEFLAVDVNTSIEVVSGMALERTEDKIYDSVLVTKYGRFVGTVTIKDVLQTAVQIQVTRAVDSSPLTGLPGNRMIEKKVCECLEQNNEFSIVYVDIDNFKAYNDTYGFNNGDLMIKVLSDCIKKTCGNAGLKGHIGGDDFVIIFDIWDIEHICQQIIDLFKESIKVLYTENDWHKGFIFSKNRYGIEEKFPIASLSISAVTNKSKVFQSVDEFSKTIASIKKQCKQQEGDYVMIL
jgi:diguanylate cyclase (GGDEF)-like protein